MKTSVWTGLLLVVATTTTVVQAQEKSWAGTWRDEATDQARSVVVEEDAQAVTTVVVDDVPVTCRGHSLGPWLALSGKLVRSRGVTGVLEDREADDGPSDVRVDVMPEEEAEDGSERALVRVRLGRRVVREERWRRPGPARLEILRTEGVGGDGLDPIERGLTVHVRVRGRAQDVVLQVELSRGSTGHRPSFYRQAGVRRGVIREVRAGVLEPGEHAIEWDGRDGTSAKRIALQGAYVVRVDSAERRADATRSGQSRPCEVDVDVARPRAVVHAPVLTRHRSSPETTAKLTAELGDEYAVERTTSSVSAGAFMRRLRTLAVCYVDTHGAPGAFVVGDFETIQPADVLVAKRGDGGKPLADVHAVFVSACEVARPQDANGRPLALDGLLLAAGVDVVVTFRSPVLASDLAAYHDLLGPRLLEYGAPIERATHDAARKAAEDAGYRWNELVLAVRQGVPKSSDLYDVLGSVVDVLTVIERLEPVKDALVVRTAPGIDAATEALMPARYGRSTN